MTVLSASAVEQKLGTLKGWKLEGAEIVRHFEFPTFPAAIRFVNQVAEKAEAANHHPDIDIRYNKVRLALVSHDAGGLTDRDFGLAAAINQLA
jgi:4a-hydroxytetrahydrobiopterin dehydratase